MSQNCMKIVVGGGMPTLYINIYRPELGAGQVCYIQLSHKHLKHFILHTYTVVPFILLVINMKTAPRPWISFQKKELSLPGSLLIILEIFFFFFLSFTLDCGLCAIPLLRVQREIGYLGQGAEQFWLVSLVFAFPSEILFKTLCSFSVDLFIVFVWVSPRPLQFFPIQCGMFLQTDNQLQMLNVPILLAPHPAALPSQVSETIGKHTGFGCDSVLLQWRISLGVAMLVVLYPLQRM